MNPIMIFMGVCIGLGLFGLFLRDWLSPVRRTRPEGCTCPPWNIGMNPECEACDPNQKFLGK